MKSEINKDKNVKKEENVKKGKNTKKEENIKKDNNKDNKKEVKDDLKKINKNTSKNNSKNNSKNSSKNNSKNNNKDKKVENKNDKVKKIEKIENKEEESIKSKHIFIYTFMAIMLIAIVTLLFIILNNRFSIIYKNPIAKIDVEGYGEITIELEPSKAPNTVNHFIKLVQDGFYDGKVIYGKDAVSLHFGRGAKGEFEDATTSMVDKTVEEGSSLDFAYEIDGEFEKNSFKFNNLKHQKYVVSLARADYSGSGLESVIPQEYEYNSGAPVFKILFEDAPGMDGNYAAFGKVIDGKEIIDELAKDDKLRFEIETEEDKEDLNEFDKFVKINSITVDTFGREFSDLKLHKKFSAEEYLVKLLENKFE